LVSSKVTGFDTAVLGWVKYKDFSYQKESKVALLLKRVFEKWYSVIFITLLPPLVPPCKGGKQ
jgi:hypothetical protein